MVVQPDPLPAILSVPDTFIEATPFVRGVLRHLGLDPSAFSDDQIKAATTAVESELRCWLTDGDAARAYVEQWNEVEYAYRQSERLARIRNAARYSAYLDGADDELARDHDLEADPAQPDDPGEELASRIAATERLSTALEEAAQERPHLTRVGPSWKLVSIKQLSRIPASGENHEQQ